MTSTAGLERQGASGSHVERRLAWHVVVPAAVACAAAGLVLWSAGATLRPVQVVDVAPAVFDRSSAGIQPEAAPRRGVTVQAPGWLEPDPYGIACSALIDGVIEEMFVLEGERVERGMVVAQLVDTELILGLELARSELDAAEAELLIALAERDAAKERLEHPIERERAVQVARFMLEETTAELAQLPALIAAESATFERLDEEYRRSVEAFTSGGASQTEVILAEKRARAQQASLDALRQREEILAARIRTLTAELAAAERNAALLIEERRADAVGRAAASRAESKVRQAKVAVELAVVRLSRTRVIAPIDGYVQKRVKKPGDKVMLAMDDPHSAHIVHLYDPAKLQVRVDVPLADAAHVFEGQACEIVVEILPERVFKGVVTRITHEADLQKNTLQVKVRVHEPAFTLRPEMLSRVKFLPGKAEASQGEPGPGVLVPAAAIDRSGSSAHIWVVRDRHGDQGRARTVAVRPGADVGGWVRVEGELRTGELVVTSPQRLREGLRVRMRRTEAES
ncbi:MAG: efflux RND transporter periplasmic adaptor subunit [Phycisphaeraceae bacterium]|nr:efflux RND transporter periplasmic adaptor subunit [Phycisphaeraceae bacterium]